jgi:hypothetical protein
MLSDLSHGLAGFLPPSVLVGEKGGKSLKREKVFSSFLPCHAFLAYLAFDIFMLSSAFPILGTLAHFSHFLPETP